MLSAMMHKPVIAKSLHWYRDHPKMSLISATDRTSLADERGTRSATASSPSVDFAMVTHARARRRASAYEDELCLFWDKVFWC